MGDEDDQPTADAPEAISFTEFLVDTPPGREAIVSLLAREQPGRAPVYWLLPPEIEIYCRGCRGDRFFDPVEEDPIRVARNEFYDTTLVYRCRNCKRSEKRISFAHMRTESAQGSLYKYGELPGFGEPTPREVLDLFGDDSHLFLRGRQSENQGLGIGAFTYYRRVVESHKNALLDQILEVAKTLNASEDRINALEHAKGERSFSKSLEIAGVALPDVLRHRGHNPLTLFHDVISDGIHERTDEECLKNARAIRLVLTDLVDRIRQVLRSDEELAKAIGHLTRIKNQGT